MAVTVGLVSQRIEEIAPKAWAEDWDNVGLLVGSHSAPVERILITLDGTLEVIEEAKAFGAQLIIAHHPIMFRPLKNLRADHAAAQVPIRLVQENIAYYAAHTNLDQSHFSSSWAIGKMLGLNNMEIMAPMDEEALVKLAVFVPQKSAEAVREALVRVGVGNGTTDGEQSAFYSECFFQSQGEGTFRPLPGANPAIGTIDELTRVAEVKLESILPERLMDRAIRALRKAHPYEEPAYDLIPLRNHGKARGYGVIGTLAQPETLETLWTGFLERLNQTDVYAMPYDLAGVRLAGSPEKQVRKVAIVNGSGGRFIPKAQFKGADLLITGDVDHHAVLDALEGDLAIGDLGHFLSEAPMLQTLYRYLAMDEALQGVEIRVSSSNKGPWK